MDELQRLEIEYHVCERAIDNIDMVNTGMNRTERKKLSIKWKTKQMEIQKQMEFLVRGDLEFHKK